MMHDSMLNFHSVFFRHPVYEKHYIGIASSQSGEDLGGDQSDHATKVKIGQKKNC